MSSAEAKRASDSLANPLPLTGFLASLSAIEIRTTPDDILRIALTLRAEDSWDREQLRAMLMAVLARSPEQQERFAKHFEAFFPIRSSEDRVQGPLSLQGVVGKKDRQKSGTHAVSSKGNSRHLWRAAVLLLLFLLAGGLGIWLWGHYPAPAPPKMRKRSAAAESISPSVLSNWSHRQRVYFNAPVFQAKTASRLPTARWFFACIFLAFAVPAYCLCLWRWLESTLQPTTSPSEAPDLSQPLLFRPALIGGKPAPLLNDRSMDLVMESLGMFRTGFAGPELNGAASAKATAENCIPKLIFEIRRRLWTVLILEDSQAEPLTWSTLPSELASGLADRNVSVLHGSFPGVPDTFRAAEGNEVRLADLEGDQRDYVVLLFSDGKGLSTPHASLALERLARLPRIAWMQLQERRAWGREAEYVAAHGLAIYPASLNGLLEALRGFIGERGRRPIALETWRGLPPYRLGAGLAQYIEVLLGDSLLWAQECAMMLPPISFGLIDGLRRRFHPALPPQRLERLLTLPGTLRNAGGVCFAWPVLACLRTGFKVRHSTGEQQKVIAFLLEQIRRAEPQEWTSLAHQAWEWRLERVRLEMEPDRSLGRLAVLAQGPLEAVIRADLSHVQLGPIRTPGTVPLRLKPGSQKGMDRLTALATGSPLPRLREEDDEEPWPVLLLAGAFVGLSGLFLWVISNFGPSVRILPDRSLTGAPIVRLEENFQSRWASVGEATVTAKEADGFLFPISKQGKHRIISFAGGISSEPMLISSTQKTTVLLLKDGRKTRPCRESFTNLTIDRCRAKDPVRSPRSDWPQSIAVAIHDAGDGGADWLGNFLLDIGAIDTLYTVQTGDGIPLNLQKHIIEDWDPWTEHLQLILWTAGKSLPTPGLHLVVPFQRTVEIGPLPAPEDKRITVALPYIKDSLVAYLRVLGSQPGESMSELDLPQEVAVSDQSQNLVVGKVGTALWIRLIPADQGILRTSDTLPPGLGFATANLMIGTPKQAGTWWVALKTGEISGRVRFEIQP